MKCKELADLIGLYTKINVYYHGIYTLDSKEITAKQLKRKYGEKEISSIFAGFDQGIIEIELKI